jgi:hypothetical protein
VYIRGANRASFAEYERRIRDQMMLLFGDDGFDPRTGVAGIVLYRWGLAYINPAPGFMYRVNESTGPPEVIPAAPRTDRRGSFRAPGTPEPDGAAAKERRAVEALVEAVL